VFSDAVQLASTAARLRRKCPTTDSSPEFGALRTDPAWSKRTYWSKKSSLDWSRCPSVFFCVADVLAEANNDEIKAERGACRGRVCPTEFGSSSPNRDQQKFQASALPFATAE
jgi:hypothetical protein